MRRSRTQWKRIVASDGHAGSEVRMSQECHRHPGATTEVAENPLQP